MGKATEMLSYEHKNILKVIDAMEAECLRLEKGGKLDSVFFEKAVYFIRNYADRFHHAKEEDILFREMRKNETSMHCNPIDQMLYEHELGRGFVKGIELGLKNSDKSGVMKNARGYTELLRQHIFKEDNILYPMADSVIAGKAQKAMLDEFAEVEKSGKFADVKEKCLSISASLGKGAC